MFVLHSRSDMDLNISSREKEVCLALRIGNYSY